MRTNPFTDSLHFLAGDTPDHMALGNWRWVLVAAFALLLAGSVAIAAANLARDPAQRNGSNALVWFMRVMVGAMWFQGSLWKLPLPVSGGFSFWLGQTAQHGAFGWYRALVAGVLQPGIAALDPATFALEMAMGACLMLGIAVRGAGVVGALFMLNLWIGLYRADAEWPWNYVFCLFLHLMFAVARAGRAWGVDAMLARRLAADAAWERGLRALG